MVTVTNPGTTRISVAFSGNGVNIDRDSLSSACSLRSVSTNSIISVPFALINNANSQNMSAVYAISTAGLADGTYNPIVYGQRNTSGQAASAQVLSTVQTTAAIRDGINVGFDPAETNDLTVSRVCIER